MSAVFCGDRRSIILNSKRVFRESIYLLFCLVIGCTGGPDPDIGPSDLRPNTDAQVTGEGTGVDLGFNTDGMVQPSDGSLADSGLIVNLTSAW